MEQILDFFQNLLDTSDWPPRWYCGTWSDFHGWLYILSDIAIWGAYFAIPVIIIWFIQKRPDIPFLPVFWLFGAFIVLCGTTHIIDALIFWWPNYRIGALTRFFTAIISWVTVFALVRDLPKALRLKKPEELKLEVEKRESSENELRSQNELLERMFSEMNHREKMIKELQAEVARLKNAGS
ncbi:MAG: hypothetical protein HKN32_05255 [Flavobacteriales bacterium]|nr:hypothetical protein [Flavobacteriales bacterium]